MDKSMPWTKTQKPKSSKDFDWALGPNRLSLRLLGIWPQDEYSAATTSSRSLRVPAMILAIFSCLCLPQFYALTRVSGDLSLVIDNLMTSIACFVSCVKLFFIWNNREELSPVVKSTTSDWLRPKESWELEEMTSKASHSRTFLISGVFVLFGCYTGFAVGPLIGLHVRTITNVTDHGDRYLIVQSEYPYDYTSSPRFELTYASQLVASMLIAVAFVVPDSYFVALVAHLSGQFKILGVRVESLIMCDASNLDCGCIDRSLKLVISRHAHLIRMTLIIRRSFSSVMMAEMIGVSAVVCLMGCQVIGNNEGKTSPMQVMTLGSSLSTLMILFYVDCLASESLTFNSFMIFHNVYNTKWYAVPRRVAKTLVTMLIVARVPRELMIGKMFSLSMLTFWKILKSSVGYISILIAVSQR